MHQIASSSFAKLAKLTKTTYIPEVHDTELSESRYDLAADLVGDVELGQGHVRRAEHGVLGGRGRHDGQKGHGAPVDGNVSLGPAGWWERSVGMMWLMESCFSMDDDDVEVQALRQISRD
jgi:hypothetical protein